MKMVNVTTSGNMVQDLVAHVQRFTMTGAKNMDVANQTVSQAVTVTGLWKFGIMYLRSLMAMGMDIMKNSPIRI